MGKGGGEEEVPVQALALAMGMQPRVGVGQLNGRLNQGGCGTGKKD